MYSKEFTYSRLTLVGTSTLYKQTREIYTRTSKFPHEVEQMVRFLQLAKDLPAVENSQSLVVSADQRKIVVPWGDKTLTHEWLGHPLRSELFEFRFYYAGACFYTFYSRTASFNSTTIEHAVTCALRDHQKVTRHYYDIHETTVKLCRCLHQVGMYYQKASNRQPVEYMERSKWVTHGKLSVELRCAYSEPTPVVCHA
jgi:hypothetical protein